MSKKQQPPPEAPRKPPVWKLGWLNVGVSFGWPDAPGVVQGTVVSKNTCEVSVSLPDGRTAHWAPGTEVHVIRTAVVPEEKPALPVVEIKPAPPQKSILDAYVAPPPKSILDAYDSDAPTKKQRESKKRASSSKSGKRTRKGSGR